MWITGERPLISGLRIKGRTYCDRLTDLMIENNNVQAINIRLTPEGSFCDVIFHAPSKWSRLRAYISKNQRFETVYDWWTQYFKCVVVCMAKEMGISEDILRRTLAHFEGVRRRSTITGIALMMWCLWMIMHMILAVIKGAVAMKKGGLILIVQPHR